MRHLAMFTSTATLGIWAFFVLGQALHAWLRAWMVVVSPKNPTIPSYAAYWHRYNVVILLRAFAGTCLFILFMFGAGYAEQSFPGFLPTGGNAAVRVAVAGIFGLATDSILDKFFARFEWLKGALPEVPAQEDTPNADK